MPRPDGKLQTRDGLALATSANGVVREGAAIPLGHHAPGSLVVEAESRITTSGVNATFRPQVSMDGIEWYDVRASNNAALVATANGTGSEVITRLALAMPDVSGWRWFRCNAVLAGATTAAADRTRVLYRYRSYGSD
jgi:hypothetical protein